jgi:arabinan endo-1,5-alpha-L-arabinosidase
VGGSDGPPDAGGGTGGALGTGGVPSTGGAPATGGAPTGGDRCDVAVHDPARPPGVLPMAGDLGTHDPTAIEENGTFYLYQTGPRLPGKTSGDLARWNGAPSALGSQNPAWIAQQVSGATDLWAPDLSRFSNRFHLYYSASTFGSNYSCIGHATRDTMQSGSWSDLGPVLCSNHGTNDNFNAIDPNVVLDEGGTPWLSFGSFWSGIKLIRLNQDGSRADDTIQSIASRGGGAVEAPIIVRRCGFYYLFVSFDRCCAGENSTYNIRVGRSENVSGPYADRSGTPMMNGGGTMVLSGSGEWAAVGHNAVIFVGDRAYNVYHAYPNSGSYARLRVADLVWDADGWPISGGP